MKTENEVNLSCYFHLDFLSYSLEAENGKTEAFVRFLVSTEKTKEIIFLLFFNLPG